MATLEVAYFRVQGLSVPVLTLADRRLPEHRRTRWCFLRDMEAVLYGNANSTGAMHRLLARESLCVPPPTTARFGLARTPDPRPPSPHLQLANDTVSPEELSGGPGDSGGVG
jgi:hypothetical protein